MAADSEVRNPVGLVNSPTRMQWRFAKDRMAAMLVRVGGMSVIFAVTLIFFYLLWIVLPLFKGASMDEAGQYPLPGSPDRASLLWSIEEQAEVGLRVSADGRLVFFELDSGAVRQTHDLGVELSAASEVDQAKGLFAVLATDGRVQLLRQRYVSSYPGSGQRIITPRLEFPYGDEGLELAPGSALAVRDSSDTLTLGAVNGTTLMLKRYAKSTSFLDDSISLEETANLVLSLPRAIDQIIIEPLQEWLYAFNYASGEIYFYDIRRLPAAVLVETLSSGADTRLTAATLLAGGISLITASSDGRLRQWFPLRDAQGSYRLRQIRSFARSGQGPVRALLAEHSRRGFMSLGESGAVGVYYATSERRLMQRRWDGLAWQGGAVAPRAKRMLLESDRGRVHVIALDNEHPEVSWKALWGKIWYESYPGPDYIWQSSAANSDFEPKFSLSPLSFGTLKAAFYAMLFAVPLAIGGAIFTAYFMSPQLRQMVKPTIEVMEALPTVILGFLAGLWLAPFVENYLPGIFLLLVFVPLAMPITGWLWGRLPSRLRQGIRPGWEPVILILPLVLAGGLALLLSKPLELAWFGGSMPHWLDNTLGIDFDQRNSLVVGLAMGFAVIPTIFSIAEDAIFSVPKQLTQGSLALGASPWQTLVRVVLPTASPGIFSALMIGMGRAVGETMIVLMATGNTPIMDFNIFEGFRTLSANIAVEMPESEVGSTHFRILFLAGLVLFLFTFAFNTVAEVVRQRLRVKYSNL